MKSKVDLVRWTLALLVIFLFGGFLSWAVGGETNNPYDKKLFRKNGTGDFSPEHTAA